MTLAAETILRWRKDPVAFVREVFETEPDVWQKDALNALGRGELRIAIRSGHGVGKTAFLSWVIIWFLVTRWPCKIPCTAPSAPQLYDTLWAEVRQWIRRMPEALANQFVILQDRISLVGGAMENFASARTSRKEQPDALQGFHSENLLFVIDEAAGVPDVIFEVSSGALSTPGAIQILTGNPTRSSGYFFNAFRAGSGWWNRTVSCLEASRVSKTWVEEMKATWGEDSDIFRYRVLGMPPTSDTDQFIPTELVEAAMERDIVPTGRAIWGLDVARFGNDASVLAKRRGMVIQPLQEWNKLDLMELTGRVVNEWNATPEDELPEIINVDAIGLGSGVCDRLNELELPAVAVNVSESSIILEKDAHRLRDELWIQGKRFLESRLCKLPKSQILLSDFTGIRVGYSSAGKIKMESKDEMKKRGLRSPNHADAVLLTFANQFMDFTRPAKGRSDWKTPIVRSSGGTYA